MSTTIPIDRVLRTHWRLEAAVLVRPEAYPLVHLRFKGPDGEEETVRFDLHKQHVIDSMRDDIAISAHKLRELSIFLQRRFHQAAEAPDLSEEPMAAPSHSDVAPSGQRESDVRGLKQESVAAKKFA